MHRRDWWRMRYGRLLGLIYTRLPALARRWGRRFDALSAADTPLAPMRRPLRDSRLALITTGGAHLRGQAPFDMGDSRGDPSYRAIPPDVGLADLTITHNYYDHSDAQRDMNILLPIGLLRELVARGDVGGLGTCYGFMGHIEPPHVETLLRRTAPEVARRLRQEQIDAVLLTPA